jgi:membrane protease YdiL (CAAX protease family)
MAARRSTAWSLLGVIVAFGLASLPISRWTNEFADVRHLVGHEIIWWAIVALVLAYVRLVERRPLSSIGFRSLRKTDGVLAVLAAVVMLSGLAGIYYLVLPRLGFDESQRVDELLATPLWWRVISVLRAAVSEEVIFRGYGIERLREVTGSAGLAAVISCVVFTVAHVGPWGWGHLLIAGFGGTVLTALYLWRRNLWVNIIAHAIVDGATVLGG